MTQEWQAVNAAQWAQRAFPTPIRGPAYSRTFRLTALAVVLLLFAGAVHTMIDTPAADEARRFPTFFVLVLGMMVFILVVLWRATTTVDVSGIHQTGLLERHVAWDEVAGAHLLKFGLTPRLVVRTSNGRLRVFHGGSAPLRAAFGAVTAAQRRR